MPDSLNGYHGVYTTKNSNQINTGLNSQQQQQQQQQSLEINGVNEWVEEGENGDLHELSTPIREILSQPIHIPTCGQSDIQQTTQTNHSDEQGQGQGQGQGIPEEYPSHMDYSANQLSLPPAGSTQVSPPPLPLLLETPTPSSLSSSSSPSSNVLITFISSSSLNSTIQLISLPT